ncbi:AraC family transcriptional regulator [Flavobacterium wongokense]|uniref:AraC family transcriptional regulator n=1 Tax=Flavobacterium wongokense TaxID=2910674 RepID=UPI001F35BF2B|nr:helix-turn-helix domain-containing protein [Flavobacterium sp. WG47]MCF6131988.1 helix-turn-helix domain-containing protein [Flavobacterium sp. WG47]
MMKIYIRNMACESCMIVVREALKDLDLNPVKVSLGQAEIKEELTEAKKKKLDALINKAGLEIVESKGGILIEKIKNYCQEYVVSEKHVKVNISEFLSKKLDRDYNYLSNIFSEVELCTIVHYINLLKIERAKEMILFEDNNLTEIAHKLNFNSLSAFSTQFKKITGYNPTHFKNLKHKRRIAIQKLTKENQ